MGRYFADESALPILARGQAHRPLEAGCKVTLGLEAGERCDLLHGQPGVNEEFLRPFNAGLAEQAIEAGSSLAGKEMAKVILAHSDMLGNLTDIGDVVVMLGNEATGAREIDFRQSRRSLPGIRMVEVEQSEQEGGDAEVEFHLAVGIGAQAGQTGELGPNEGVAFLRPGGRNVEGCGKKGGFCRRSGGKRGVQADVHSAGCASAGRVAVGAGR